MWEDRLRRAAQPQVPKDQTVGGQVADWLVTLQNLDPRSSGSSQLILGLIKGLPVPLHGVPVDGQGLPGLMLGVEGVQGRSQGSLALLTSLLLSLGDPILQGLARIGDHVLQGVPSLQLLGPGRTFQ